MTRKRVMLVTPSVPDGLPKALHRHGARREKWINGEPSIRREFSESTSFALAA